MAFPFFTYFLFHPVIFLLLNMQPLGQISSSTRSQWKKNRPLSICWEEIKVFLRSFLTRQWSRWFASFAERPICFNVCVLYVELSVISGKGNVLFMTLLIEIGKLCQEIDQNFIMKMSNAYAWLAGENEWAFKWIASLFNSQKQFKLQLRLQMN